MHIQNFSTREKEKKGSFSNLTLFFTDKALAADIIPGSLDFPCRFRGCLLSSSSCPLNIAHSWRAHSRDVLSLVTELSVKRAQGRWSPYRAVQCLDRALLSTQPVFFPFPGRSWSPKLSFYGSSFHNKKRRRRKQPSLLNTLLQLDARKNCHNNYINIWWVGFERQALKLCSVQSIETPSVWVDRCLIPLFCKFPVPVFWSYWWAPRTP